MTHNLQNIRIWNHNCFHTGLPGLNPEPGEKGRSGIDGVPGRYAIR